MTLIRAIVKKLSGTAWIPDHIALIILSRTSSVDAGSSYFFHKIKNRFESKRDKYNLFVLLCENAFIAFDEWGWGRLFRLYAFFFPKRKNNLFNSFHIEYLLILEIAEKKNTKKK